MKDSFCDLGFTKLDTGRKERTGFGEVVFCQGKRNVFLKDIFSRLFEANGEVLGTRATQEQFELVKEILPQATYDSVSRIIKVQGEKKKLIGNIAVCTAGTADIPVAEESAQTAEFFGSYVERIFDVGVSGIHRMLSQTEKLEKANVENYLTGILLRITDSEIEYVNAGHTDLLCIDSKRKVSVAGGANGSFRGSFLGIEGLPDNFETVDIPLEKNSCYIMFTDCLTESRNLAGDELGIELLQKILARAPQGTSAKQLLEYLIDIFEAFTEAVPLRDDQPTGGKQDAGLRLG